MSKVRITSTTGLVIMALGNILRKEWELNILTHECWTLDVEPRAKW